MVINSGRRWLGMMNSNNLISNFLFYCRRLFSKEKSLTQEEHNCLQFIDAFHTNCAVAACSGRAIKECCVHFSAITFPALIDITAVSWPTAGLTEWNEVLSTRAVGLLASTKVTSALGWYGRAATSRGCVTLGQDWPFGAGGNRQSRTRHPSTPQLFCKENTHGFILIHRFYLLFFASYCSAKGGEVWCAFETLKTCYSWHKLTAKITQSPSKSLHTTKKSSPVCGSFTTFCQSSESAASSRSLSQHDMVLRISCRRSSDPTQSASTGPQSKQPHGL